MRTRRWRARRYVNDVREIMRTYGLTWKQAQEAYRRAKDKLKYKKRNKVTRKQIVEAARPIPAEKFSLTFWFKMMDNFKEDIDSGRTISYDFSGFGGPKGELKDLAEGALVSHQIRLAGDEYFEDKYASEAAASPNDWSYYWRIMEPIGVLLTEKTAHYFWKEDYAPWQKG